MSIRARLAVLFTLAAVAFVIAGSVLFVTRLQQGLLTSIDQRLSTRVASLTGQIDAGRFRPGERLTNANGIYAQVMDPEGTVLNTSHGLTRTPLLTEAQVSHARRAATSYSETVQLEAGDDISRVPMRLRAVPMRHEALVLVVATSRVDVDTAVSSATVQLIELCAAVLVVAFAGGWLLTRAALRPVERMRREVASLGAGRIAQGIAVPRTRDEIARLGTTFNALLRRLREAAERERSFVSDAGHELRTPLAVLQGELELAQHPGRTLEELRETVAIAAEETDRLVSLAEDLLFLARGDETPALRLAELDLVDLVDQTVRALAATARGAGVELKVTAPDRLLVRADRDRIRRAFENVLVNALRFVPPGGVVQVDLALHLGEVVATISDSGPGFPTEFLPHAFERFSRVPEDEDDPARRGNGLGLAIVRSVMTGHGGVASAANGLDGGAVVTLRWPQDPELVRA